MQLVVAGMVMDRVVLARVASRWKQAMFGVEWADIIGKLCVDYFATTGEAPTTTISDLWDGWSADNDHDKETIRMTERFLNHVSEEYENEAPPASAFVLDRAAVAFDSYAYRQSRVDADLLFEQGQAREAIERLHGTRRVELGSGATIKPAEEWDVWERAFDNALVEPLVTYPGDLKRFFGDTLARSSLVAFMAADKTGKSFWLLDVIYRAISQRKQCRVAYFEAGDLEQETVLQRLGSRVCHHPTWESFHKGRCQIAIPTAIDGEGETEVEWQTFDAPLDARTAYAKVKRICRNRDVLRIECHPNSSLSVDDMDSRLHGWDMDGWRPDIVVCDYADILAPPMGVTDPLVQIDETWKRLRRLSQQRYCLVLTATQANAAGYGAAMLTRRNFSGRKTKLAHVNGMLGINVSFDGGEESEKARGVSRLNWIVRRRGAFNERMSCWTAGNLAIGNPAIVSCY